MIDTKKETEKVILFAVCSDSEAGTERSLDELSDLCSTAGAITVGRLIQNREEVHPLTYIGKGKIEELITLINRTEADSVVCDDELSPVQMKNLEDMLKCKVLDRTLVILDIFAGRAATKEGKLQVELAQLKYSMTRLSGYGNQMSRLGGGIGTRGPGEKKIETDRRRIRDRVSQLTRELKDVEKHREITRQMRKQNKVPVAALVGYTNAGKSTLLNKLTDSDVLSENRLFATLDPTTRSLTLSGKRQILLTDTVGFINKLPHHLIEAFKSTLEEAGHADILIHVVDSANPDYARQMQVVYDTLSGLNISGKPVITLFNKSDCLETGAVLLRDEKARETFSVSALTGEGIPEVLEGLDILLKESQVLIEKLFAFSEGAWVQKIREEGVIESERYLPEGIEIKAWVSRELAERMKN